MASRYQSQQSQQGNVYKSGQDFTTQSRLSSGYEPGGVKTLDVQDKGWEVDQAHSDEIEDAWQNKKRVSRS